MKQASQTLLSLISILLCAQAQFTPALPRAEFTHQLVAAAIERTHYSVRYVSNYVRIAYPGGDVPADTGVCTDEIIRIYRAMGIDLQKEVHEDMARNFELYPHTWQHRPDSNIDHRRVPNLMVFFMRKGTTLSATTKPGDYAPGDLVTWDLGGGITHIGMVVDQKGRDGSYTTLVAVRRSKMCYSTGTLSATTDITGRSHDCPILRT